jgi:hypothetical protein
MSSTTKKILPGLLLVTSFLILAVNLTGCTPPPSGANDRVTQLSTTVDDDTYAQDVKNLNESESQLLDVGLKFEFVLDGSVVWDTNYQNEFNRNGRRAPASVVNEQLVNYVNSTTEFLSKYSGIFGIRYKDGSVEVVSLPSHLVDRLNRKINLANETIQSSL